jgi:hypothetical protein
MGRRSLVAKTNEGQSDAGGHERGARAGDCHHVLPAADKSSVTPIPAGSKETPKKGENIKCAARMATLQVTANS